MHPHRAEHSCPAPFWIPPFLPPLYLTSGWSLPFLSWLLFNSHSRATNSFPLSRHSDCCVFLLFVFHFPFTKKSPFPGSKSTFRDTLPKVYTHHGLELALLLVLSHRKTWSPVLQACGEPAGENSKSWDLLLVLSLTCIVVVQRDNLTTQFLLNHRAWAPRSLLLFEIFSLPFFQNFLFW